VEHEVPAIYVYEIQVEQVVQGKGLGKFLMQFLELIARKVGCNRYECSLYTFAIF
jgi:GNAT superfamily N-acetyltransferase